MCVRVFVYVYIYVYAYILDFEMFVNSFYDNTVGLQFERDKIPVQARLLIYIEVSIYFTT